MFFFPPPRGRGVGCDGADVRFPLPFKPRTPGRLPHLGRHHYRRCASLAVEGMGSIRRRSREKLYSKGSSVHHNSGDFRHRKEGPCNIFFWGGLLYSPCYRHCNLSNEPTPATTPPGCCREPSKIMGVLSVRTVGRRGSSPPQIFGAVLSPAIFFAWREFLRAFVHPRETRGPTQRVP